MKKLILLFILTLFGMSCVVAQDNNPSQTTDLKAYVDSLSTKLNTLQHDYDYLYCSHEINRLQFELKDLMHDVNIKSMIFLSGAIVEDMILIYTLLIEVLTTHRLTYMTLLRKVLNLFKGQ